MKKLIAIAALAAATIATPALAKDAFTGPRAEVTAGYNDVTGVAANHNFAYGVEAGYDVSPIKNVTVGVNVGLSNVLDRRDVSVGARVGYELNDHALLYGKVGYSNYRNLLARNTDGLGLGVGLEVNVAGPVYVKTEYRYTDLGRGVRKNAVVGGVGFRF